MKSLHLLVTVIIFASCASSSSEKPSADSTVNVATATTKTAPINAVEILQDMTLIPLEMLDSTKLNPFEKYGISFQGMCYSCDISTIRISASDLILTNICDTSLFTRYDIIEAKQSASNFSFYTKEFTLVFEQVDQGPVYKLRSEGQLKPAKDRKLMLYYVDQLKLKHFKVRDCGEFDG